MTLKFDNVDPDQYDPDDPYEDDPDDFERIARDTFPRHVVATTASTITPAGVAWLWDGWIPLGMVSLLAGQPGRGKTTFAVAITAQVTRGTLDGALLGEPADVLFLTYEDAISQTLVPRLSAARADLDRVHFVGMADESTLDLTKHLAEIEVLADRRGARMLFIDPIVAGMPAGGVNSHRDQDVRSVLAPIAAIAERCDLAVLATSHFTKAATTALLGVGGSIGFAAAARSLLVFGSDPKDEQGERGRGRVIAHAKCNVGPQRQSRQVWIQPASVPAVCDGLAREIDTSIAILGGEVDVAADDLVHPREHNGLSPRVAATKFLRDLLADGPHRASEVIDLASDAGIADKTLRRAKADLGVDNFQKDRVWWWHLPPAHPERNS